MDGAIHQRAIIPIQCFYRFFGDFDWSVGKTKLFLHFDKSPCVGIFDNCLDITVVDCVNNNELYINYNTFTSLNIVKRVLKLILKPLRCTWWCIFKATGELRNEQHGELCDVT